MEFKNGRCVEVTKNRWLIKEKDTIYSCIINNSYIGYDLPTVGDNVTFTIGEYGDIGVLYDLQKRSTFLYREIDSDNQAIAANFDVVFIFSSLNKDFNLNKIERMIIMAKKSKAKYIIVLTKLDLVENVDDYITRVRDAGINCPVVSISALKNIGLEDIYKYWLVGETAVLLGSSGVGKSTFINLVSSNQFNLKTSDIREKDSRGKHATTTRRFYYLDDGRCIIDEPGIRTVGVSLEGNDDVDIVKVINELSTECKFNNCKHKEEPGCAVLSAIESGVITDYQLNTYNKFLKIKKYEDRKYKINANNTSNHLKRIKKHKSASKTKKRNSKELKSFMHRY